MFDNIGQKIKAYAKIVAWIGIILSILIGVAMIITGSTSGNQSGSRLGEIVNGILVIGLGVLSSWIGSFFIYGFGELIERVQSIDEKASDIINRK